MRKRDSRAMQVLALFCLVTTVFALCFSQHAREMLKDLPGVSLHLVHDVVHDEMCGMEADSQERLRVPISSRVSH